MLKSIGQYAVFVKRMQRPPVCVLDSSFDLSAHLYSRARLQQCFTEQTHQIKAAGDQ